MTSSILPINIEKSFHITLFDKLYFIDGNLNKIFLYGTYPMMRKRRRQNPNIRELKEKMQNLKLYTEMMT